MDHDFFFLRHEDECPGPPRCSFREAGHVLGRRSGMRSDDNHDDDTNNDNNHKDKATTTTNNNNNNTHNNDTTNNKLFPYTDLNTCHVLGRRPGIHSTHLSILHGVYSELRLDRRETSIFNMVSIYVHVYIRIFCVAQS